MTVFFSPKVEAFFEECAFLTHLRSAFYIDEVRVKRIDMNLLNFYAPVPSVCRKADTMPPNPNVFRPIDTGRGDPQFDRFFLYGPDGGFIGEVGKEIKLPEPEGQSRGWLQRLWTPLAPPSKGPAYETVQECICRYQAWSTVRTIVMLRPNVGRFMSGKSGPRLPYSVTRYKLPKRCRTLVTWVNRLRKEAKREIAAEVSAADAMD